MIAHLHGTVRKMGHGELTIDVQGVGYRVTVPGNVWGEVEDSTMVHLWISTYVREDRLDLFGFREERMRMLFEELLERPGIGPRLALELCSTPPSLLAQALEGTGELLTTIKGVGKKTAEKLAIELKSLAAKRPELFLTGDAPSTHTLPSGDSDTIAALKQLGYDHATILQTLANLPKNLSSPEDRITAALRSL